MDQQTARIDGWKSIAGYLGRDRSTVIRWAKERGLPVRSLPGGKSRTVYALRDELDAWMHSECLKIESALDDEFTTPDAIPGDEPTTTPEPPPAASTTTASPRRWWGGTAVFAMFAGLVLMAFVATRDRAPLAAVLLGPVQQEKLLQARDDIASRSAGRLNTAIATLSTLRAQVPADPDVREALAEGYLLSREFGSLPDALALGNARREAMATLQWRPRSATALRVLGVVTYWWDRDPAAAGRLFRRAIDVAPNDALARQWYANILADNGEHAAAIREFDVARRLAPGATYLLADYAWGLWSAGREEEARALLVELVRQQPMLASAHDCLSVMAFAAGDLPGYAYYLHMRAQSRAAPELTAYSGMIEQEVGRSDRAAVYRAMFSRALSQAEATSQSNHSWAAFIASSFGDRAQLIDVLRRSQQRSERWGASGYTRRIGERWSADETIQRLLVSLSQSRIEPPPSDSTV